jgi:Ni/Co efflux regulator RcnB
MPRAAPLAWTAWTANTAAMGPGTAAMPPLLALPLAAAASGPAVRVRGSRGLAAHREMDTAQHWFRSNAHRSRKSGGHRQGSEADHSNKNTHIFPKVIAASSSHFLRGWESQIPSNSIPLILKGHQVGLQAPLSGIKIHRVQTGF